MIRALEELRTLTSVNRRVVLVLDTVDLALFRMLGYTCKVKDTHIVVLNCYLFVCVDLFNG